MRLLLVDDDVELCAMLAEYLGGEGFQVDFVHTGDAGLERAREGGYDAVVLDVMLPGRDGFQVIRELRKTSETPVLMLTARGDDVDTVVGLELGADDYLPKPCNPRVLAARLRALLRRGRGVEAQEPSAKPLAVGGVELDPGSREVNVDGRPLELTGAEFNVLTCLMRHAGAVVDKDRLSEEGLGRALQAYDRSVDMHVSNIRRKLGPDAQGNPRIKTIRGVGYQFITHGAA